VGQLILTDRHALGFVHENVGGHEDGVAQEAGAAQVLCGDLLLLFLVGGVALHPGNRRDHGEQEGKLSVLLEIGLAEDGALLGIKAGTDPVLDHLDGVFPESLGSVEIRGERVPVSHEEEGSQLVLEVHPVLEDAEIMSEMEGTGGAHARSSANFSTHGKCSFED
jgi:hypothetical protein